MTTFTINDRIFSRLFEDATVDLVALQNLVNAINENSYSNSVVSAAVQRNNSVFELAPPGALDEHHAGAMYSNDRGSNRFIARENNFAYQLDGKWFRADGSEPAFLADPRNARAVLGVVTHEIDHNAHQSMYDEALRLRDTPPEAYRPDLTGAARSAASVDLAMRAEVSGWYADLNTQRAEVASGRMSLGEFNARNSPMTIGGHLLQIESQGKAQGLTGDGLTQYLAEHGRQVLPSNYMPDYINSFGKGDADPIEVRKAMGYALNDPNGLKSIVQEVGPDGTYISTSEYNNGQRVETTIDGYKGWHKQTIEVPQPDGSYLTIEKSEVQSYNTDGSYGDQVTTTFDAAGRAHTVVEIDGAHDSVDYATRTTSYDARGREDWRSTLNDDGSRDNTDFDQSNIRFDSIWSNHVDPQGREDWVSTLNDDGTRDSTDFDQTNVRFDKTWSNHIDAQGREDWSRSVNDDGSVDWTDYDQTNVRGDRIWSNRTDAQGREDWRIITNDDGSKDTTDFDQSNVRSDSIWSNHVDAQGREDWVNVLNDDGSRDNTDFDQTNVRFDKTWSNHIDAQGREDWSRSINDDGSVDWTDYDQTNVRGDRIWSNRTDAQGREDWRIITNDDGSRDTLDFDQSNIRSDSIWSNHVDAQGREDWVSTLNDDGSRDSTDFDQTSVRPDRTWSNHIDAQGREDWVSVLNDDGSRDNTDFDQTNVRADRTWFNHIDAQGREDWRNVINDNGRRDWTDFDQDGSQAWNRAESHYDAQGREDYTDFFMDDGRRNSYDFDQDGSRSWSRFESSFDASGNADYSTEFFDNGSRVFIDFDRYGADKTEVRGYNAHGDEIYWGLRTVGKVLTIRGQWSPAYGEALNAGNAMSYSGIPSTSLPAPSIDYDPYPNAHAEVGPIEPAW